MRLLILTQTMDDQNPILGFFVDWVREFAKRADRVIVICLYKGEHNLPENVDVYSLGKELGVSKFEYVINFYKLIWEYRRDYDAVFVHMNQIYLILGGWLWRLWDKKMALWYVHRQKSLSLWLGARFVDKIFTSSLESFTLKSDKISYIGHGVDSNKFAGNTINQNKDKTNIVSIGRITKIKNLETLILAGEILFRKIPNLSIEFYGGAMNGADEEYMNSLKNLIKEKNLERVVTFAGPVSNADISRVYAEAKLSVNMSPDGGWDKVVIESFMALCPVFASNIGLKPVFGGYADKLMFSYGDPQDLAYKVEAFLTLENRDSIVQELHDHAVREYDFRNLIKKISLALNK